METKKLNVNGIGTAGYPALQGAGRAESNTKGDFGANVKGMDKNGNEYEQTVDVSKVNPNSCSYTEMLALNAHTGNTSDSDFLSMAIMKDKSNTASYHEKADYLSAAYALMDDMKTLGNWDGYLRYGKWINDILTYNFKMKNDFMDTYMRYRKETGIYAEMVNNISAVSEPEEAKAKRTKATDEAQEADSITDMQINMLVSEKVQARFPLQELDEEGNRKEEMYLISVDKDGIRCSKPGQDEYEWEILFTDESQYMNPFGAKFYTAEEMMQMQAELMEKKTATDHKLSDSYSILYKNLHPEYNGERIFSEYPGGPLYTADEIMEIMDRNSKDAKYQAEARK